MPLKSPGRFCRLPDWPRLSASGTVAGVVTIAQLPSEAHMSCQASWHCHDDLFTLIVDCRHWLGWVLQCSPSGGCCALLWVSTLQLSY